MGLSIEIEKERTQDTTNTLHLLVGFATLDSCCGIIDGVINRENIIVLYESGTKIRIYT